MFWRVSARANASERQRSVRHPAKAVIIKFNLLAKSLADPSYSFGAAHHVANPHGRNPPCPKMITSGNGSLSRFLKIGT